MCKMSSLIAVIFVSFALSVSGQFLGARSLSALSQSVPGQLQMCSLSDPEVSLISGIQAAAIFLRDPRGSFCAPGAPTVTTVTTETTVHATEGCAARACGATGYSTTVECNAVAAGATVKACAVTDDAVAKACLPDTFTVTCPAGNNKTVAPDFASPSIMHCKACYMQTDVVDTDPMAKAFRIAFSFGDMVDTRTGSTPTGIKEYEVYWVWKNGRANGNKLVTIKADAATSCCTKDKYSVVMLGTFSDDYDGSQRIGVMAVSSGGVRVPFFSFSSAVGDNATKVVEGAQDSDGASSPVLFMAVFVAAGAHLLF